MQLFKIPKNVTLLLAVFRCLPFDLCAGFTWSYFGGWIDLNGESLLLIIAS